ncbi:MAG: ATP-binding protein [Pseudomonadota bacterium]
MKLMQLRSMRQKLVAVVMLTTLAALLVSIGGVIAYDLRSYHKALLGDMATQAELLGHMTSAALTFDDAALARENLASLRIRPAVRAGAVYKANGTRFAAYLAKGENPAFPVAPAGDSVRVEGDQLLIYRRIVEKGEFIGTVYLRAEYRMVARALDYLAIAAAVTALAMLTAYLLMRRLDRIITAPISAITAIAHEVVDTRDYSRRAPRISDDEAGELVDSFNAMLTEIELRTRALEQSNHEIAREALQRAEAQQEVMRLNEQLEERVRVRTQQLELSNAELGVAMEAASKASQAKTSFVSSMSHELRTPLNAILGFAQILTSDAMPTTPVQKKDFANHILKSGRHLLTLINEILDLAKVESGTVALSMEPVALADMFTECAAMIAPLASQRRIRVLFPEGCPEVVLADRTRLKQVLLNLLSNAVKYNRELGMVRVEVSAPAAAKVRISVQDTGMGLGPDQVESLFQPFNRLGQENGKEEGTGIGLVVTKRLLELMGGGIGAASSSGTGSTFWIELQGTDPLPSVLAAGALLPFEAQPASQASHVLLYVEDNPANLKLVQEIIGFRSDLRLLMAPDAHLGIEMARVHLPDLILMDINLPGMSGTEALKQLRADPRTAHIPVIALTANAMPRDVERGLANGFFRYLTKPIDIDQFGEAIDSTLALVDSFDQTRKA